MFFVIDKSKIFSYMIAICTVVILFMAAAGLNSTSSDNSIMTSTNIIEENAISNKINEVNNITNAVGNAIN